MRWFKNLAFNGCLLFFSLYFMLIKLPYQLNNYQANFLILSFVFLALYRPLTLELWQVLFVSLIYDALISSAFWGEQALTLLLISYFISKFAKRLYFYSIWQQCFFVAVLAMVYGLFIALFESLDGNMVMVLPILMQSITTLFAWVLLNVLFSTWSFVRPLWYRFNHKDFNSYEH